MTQPPWSPNRPSGWISLPSIPAHRVTQGFLAFLTAIVIAAARLPAKIILRRLSNIYGDGAAAKAGTGDCAHSNHGGYFGNRRQPRLPQRHG